MKINTELLRETALFVKQYLHENLTDKCSFHNYEHTENIVRYCDAIGLSMDLGKQDLMILHLAAWFQETGFCSHPQNHEEVSASIAMDYFKEKGLEEETIHTIAECILSTRSPQQPVSLSAQVLCDANMYYMADKNYLYKIENLRLESAELFNIKFTDEEWLLENINKLNNHFFFTSSARKLFDKDKEKLKQKLNDQYNILHKFQTEINNPLNTLSNSNDIPSYLEVDIKLERGVETLFKITARRHMELATLAHDKANLIISINAIIFSIVLSVLVVKLDEHSYLIFPTLSLILTSVITIVIAILSTRPRILKDTSSHDQKHALIQEKNILFFGHFTKMPLNEFELAMKKTYNNRELLYESLSKDIYYQGVILVWKYKYITISYNIFLVGFIVSIIAFIVAFALH